MKIVEASFVTSAPSLAKCPFSEFPEIAFAGRSNVGKSSLVNCLLNRKGLVRTSSTPGRTQLLNFFAINNSFHFVDLPGYGFARAPRSVREKWQPMVHGYLRGRINLKAVVWMLDVRRKPSPDDLEFLDFLEQSEIPTIPVVTKVDKVGRNELGKNVKRIASETGLDEEFFVLFSALNRRGFEDLWDVLGQVLEL